MLAQKSLALVDESTSNAWKFIRNLTLKQEIIQQKLMSGPNNLIIFKLF